MSKELKPCPFCGGTVLKTGGDDKVVGVWCLSCEAAGPNHYGHHEWNDRTPPPAPNVVGCEKPLAHLVWLQGRRATDDIEDYYEVARPGDKCVDGSEPFPVYASPATSGWQPMSSAPRDGTHILALLYREATSDMDDRRWPAFSEIREIFFKPYLAFGMQLPWHAGDPFEEPSGIGSEHMGEGVPIAWHAMPSVDARAALTSAEGSEG